MRRRCPGRCAGRTTRSFLVSSSTSCSTSASPSTEPMVLGIAAFALFFSWYEEEGRRYSARESAGVETGTPTRSSSSYTKRRLIIGIQNWWSSMSCARILSSLSHMHWTYIHSWHEYYLPCSFSFTPYLLVSQSSTLHILLRSCRTRWRQK